MKCLKRLCVYKRLFIRFLLCCLFVIGGSCCVYAEENKPDYDDMKNQEIQFPIGANYYIVNGNRVSTYAPAYITEDGIIMIPLRKACGLYGVKDEQIKQMGFKSYSALQQVELLNE